MKTKKVVKAPLAKEPEYLIENPPYTIFGVTEIPESYCISMKAGGLRKMLDEFHLDGEDVFRIESFAGYRKSEFSFIKHEAKNKIAVKKHLSNREKQIYNEAIRDALKEVWLHDGIIPDEVQRQHMCESIQKKLSYQRPEPNPLQFQQP